MNYLKQRLKDIFSTTYEKGIQWEGNLSDIDYYSLSCKAAANDVLYNFKECNICMFKCNYENEEAILIVFSIPINLSSKESKHITERVMNTIQLLEETFVYIDHLSSIELKEEKFVYLTAIKKIS